MTKRTLGALFLAAAILFTAGPADAQEELMISVDPGPHAPGDQVVVTVTGIADDDPYLLARQCGVDLETCTSFSFEPTDGADSVSIEVTVRRRLGGFLSIADCAVDACVIQVQTFAGATAQAPISVDGSAPLPRPTLELLTPTPLPERTVVELTGSGFYRNEELRVLQCFWTSTFSCPIDNYAYTDGDGNAQISMPVSRVLGDLDCAAPRSNCAVWVFPSGHLDFIAAKLIVFDGSQPPTFPEITLTPESGLLHLQSVNVAGEGFAPAGFVDVEQCARPDTPDQRCSYVGGAPTDAAGAFTLDFAARRRINVDDCAVVECTVLVRQYPYPGVSAALDFDDSVPPPPIPTVTVAPDTGLIDRQVVDIMVADAAPDSQISVSLCLADHSNCGAYASATLVGADDTLQMALPRTIDAQDCAVVGCVLDVRLYGPVDFFNFVLPVAFDPDAPLGPGSIVRAVPDAGLWDRQRVEVRGDDLRPGAYVVVRQCADPEGLPGNCGDSSSTETSVDALGRIRSTAGVRRVLDLADGPLDCAVAPCFLVINVDGDPTAVAIAFDPDGPVGASDLPPQLECVAWPTDGWPTGDLPAGVDAAAVAAAGEQMVSFGGDSVVVIHGGRLVYENYSDDGGIDVIMPSFSVSKSFTSTIVGLLVDDGLLELDERMPFDDWADPADPRSAITLRHVLNMSSGLEWEENYFDSNADVIQMILGDDPSAYIRAKPLEFEPGSQFRYSTGDTQLLGSLIGEVAGVNGDAYVDFLHEQLFDPLGILPVTPLIDRAGVWGSGYSTNTTTRNFAKLGLLYLRSGMWEDEQFLSSDWVDFVRTPSPAYSGYGGQFWLDGDGSFRMVGLQGQLVHIVPELDLIVASSNGAGSYPMIDLFRNAAPASCGEAGAVLTDDTATVTALNRVAIDVLANDDGGPIGLAPATLTVAGRPAGGSATVNEGHVRYEPDPGFTGTDTFSYVVCTADRRQCLEAEVAVEVTPLRFEFRPPTRPDINRRAAGSRVLVRFRTEAGAAAVESVWATPIDCDTEAPLADPTAVDAALSTGGRRNIASFRWATDPGWTGCHLLEIVLVDGTAHGTVFAWV